MYTAGRKGGSIASIEEEIVQKRTGRNFHGPCDTVDDGLETRNRLRCVRRQKMTSLEKLRSDLPGTRGGSIQLPARGLGRIRSVLPLASYW